MKEYYYLHTYIYDITCKSQPVFSTKLLMKEQAANALKSYGVKLSGL